MPSAARLGTTHLLLVSLPIVVTLFLLIPSAHERTHGSAPAAVEGPTVEVWRVLLALAVIIAAARLAGTVVSALAQPRVVGEMLSGILLGPSVLGLLAPDFSAWLFAPGVLPHVDMVAQLGLAFFMFLVGLEFDGHLLRGRGSTASVIGQVSVAIPLALGVAVGTAIYGELGSSTGDRETFALFIGAAMSVTAFPVLARILMERGIFQTPVGTLAMVCAAIADLVAWLLLACVIAQIRGDSWFAVIRTALLTLVLVLIMLYVVRPALRRMLRPQRSGPVADGALALMSLGVLASAVAADWIGIHLVFGAFLFGTVCPRNAPRLREASGKIQSVTLALLLPPFFALVGLQTEMGLLGRNASHWWWFLLLLAVAIAGKWAGTTVGALGTGIDRMSAVRLGLLTNCKGLTELVILSIGLELGILSPLLFTILVLVALVATVMTTPLLALLDRIERVLTGQRDSTTAWSSDHPSPWNAEAVPASSQEATPLRPRQPRTPQEGE
ncbi:cation:proton antiporter [Streptomyces sp. NPDC050164]|uniref:cation:proton antiporter domain-containing protein n=1 Tax=Streptomyces sp. NPDC050164 TaxID=3365605 RepID=UPI0037B912D8